MKLEAEKQARIKAAEDRKAEILAKQEESRLKLEAAKQAGVTNVAIAALTE